MINELVLPGDIDEGNRSQRIAFELGWDMAVGGLFKLPYYAEGSESVRQGWDAAVAEGKRGVYKKDLFLSKYFHLRFGAWERNRHFSNAITPEYLAGLNVERCPVTGVVLTHGEFSETDASFDRLNNDAAYAVGNLAVMSVRANFAKCQYNYHKIIKFAYDLNVEIPTSIDNFRGVKGNFEPLTRAEWARMASLCSNAPSIQHADGSMEVTNWFTPCVTLPPPGSLISVPNHLQIAIAFKSNIKNLCKRGAVKSKVHLIQEEFSDSLKSALSEQHKTDFNKLITRAAKVAYDLASPVSIWFNSALYKHFVEFYKSLSPAEKAHVKSLIENSRLVSYEEYNNAQDLKLDNFGYTKKPAKRKAFKQVESENL